jgi:hypothetical protein
VICSSARLAPQCLAGRCGPDSSGGNTGTAAECLGRSHASVGIWRIGRAASRPTVVSCRPHGHRTFDLEHGHVVRPGSVARVVGPAERRGAACRLARSAPVDHSGEGQRHLGVITRHGEKRFAFGKAVRPASRVQRSSATVRNGPLTGNVISVATRGASRMVAATGYSGTELLGESKEKWNFTVGRAKNEPVE